MNLNQHEMNLLLSQPHQVIATEETSHFFFNKLSNKEMEALYFYIRGQSTQQIAKHLCRSIKSIETYIARVKVKFKVKSTSQLIAKAIGLGFVHCKPASLFGI